MLAEIEIISGPGENSSLFCDQQWIAWSNNTGPFFDLFFWSYPCQLEINGTLVNGTCPAATIQVLEGSMPYIDVVYFEEGETNDTLGRPVICFTPPSGPTTVEESDSTPLVVVIYTTSSLAIIASLIALVTYSLLHQLRTLPGLLMMNLFLSFLLGEIMLQVRIGLEYTGQYITINYVLQQGFLVSRFVWMSIVGFEMCRSLYKGVRMRIDSHRYQKWIMLAVYMTIGWGITVIVTVIIGAVEVKGGEGIRRALGAFGYITTIVPIAITQLINIGAVVFISIVVVSAARQQKRVREGGISKQNINFVRLFLVLLTVLGLIWLIFFVAISFPEINTLGFVITYVIITDTQPVFVCIAFICTPKVLKMCLVRLHLRKSGSNRMGMLSTYSSSSGLRRGRTQTSLVSINLPPPSKRTPPPMLQPITEEGEEKKDSNEKRIVAENGNGVVKTVKPNGILQQSN